MHTSLCVQPLQGLTLVRVAEKLGKAGLSVMVVSCCHIQTLIQVIYRKTIYRYPELEQSNRVFPMPETVLRPDKCLQAGRGAYWEHFHHVADVGSRGIGLTLGSAFEQAATAMTAVVTDPDAIKPEETIEISCRAPNLELLLVDWLNAIIFEMATRKMVFCGFSVCIRRNRLNARISGEPIDVQRHAPATEVKGATLSELEVACGADGRWHAQCIVDV